MSRRWMMSRPAPLARSPRAPPPRTSWMPAWSREPCAGTTWLSAQMQATFRPSPLPSAAALRSTVPNPSWPHPAWPSLAAQPGHGARHTWQAYPEQYPVWCAGSGQLRRLAGNAGRAPRPAIGLTRRPDPALCAQRGTLLAAQRPPHTRRYCGTGGVALLRTGLRLVEHGEYQPADHGHVLVELDPLQLAGGRVLDRPVRVPGQGGG